MKETSAGAVIFRQDKVRKYLLLHYEEEHWDFAKGHIEKGEQEKETVIREVKEETGIKNIMFIEGFREKISYNFRNKKKLVKKDVFFYLVKTKEKDVEISFEHIDHEWLEYEEALEILTFENARNILRKAEEFLNRLS